MAPGLPGRIVWPSMGVTIHFSGRLRSAADAPRVVEELLDIAETLDWPHVIIDDPGDVGISLEPHPECERFLLRARPK